MPHFAFRRLFGAVLTLLLTGLVLGGFPSTAGAEEGFRYWNYFHVDQGKWVFSQVGPAGYKELKDGDVEAYRFGTAESSDTDGIPPRADLDKVGFEAICAETKAGDAQKRIAVLLDYGIKADAKGETPPAPRGECAVVATDANGQQVLEEVADVRLEGGLTCAIDGYPAQGCGDPVPDVKAADERTVAFELPAANDSEEAAEEGSADDGLPWPLLGVALLVLVIGTAALVLSRRNRSA